ncbi:bifunctional riboflavin kinase/FAD synthetase [Actinomycetota bacterium]
MRVLRGDYDKWEALNGPTWITIGFFDGVHVGHQSILAALRERAGAGTVGVVTFREHPAVLLRPEAAPLMLTSLEQRLELLESYDADVVAVLEFEQVREMEPAGFVSTIVDGVLNGVHVAVGMGFRFGHNAGGNEQVLAKLGEEFDFSVEVVDIMGGDNPVSSTVVREALARGDVESAAAKLGRLFQLRGAVVAGDRRGRRIGFPTANLELDPRRAVPQHGVYSALTRVADGTWHPSVVNIGVRPTFGGMTRVVEVHLLDESLDLYGQELHLEFVTRIRPERRFDGIDELVEQIGRDIQVARQDLAVHASNS